MLHLILGGAALQRCDNCIVLNPALAAEGAYSTPSREVLPGDSPELEWRRCRDHASAREPRSHAQHVAGPIKHKRIGLFQAFAGEDFIFDREQARVVGLE
jgi:hypothetical protein